MTQKVIDPNTGREIATSDSAVRNAVESERPIYRVTRDGPGKLRVFDVVSREWTGPIAQNFVHQLYLRKVVFKCSACTFTTSNENQVERHVGSVFNAQNAHTQATLQVRVEGGSTWQECSGCGGRFRAGRMAGEKHIESIMSAPAMHLKAEELIVKRFALEPSEPVIISRKSISIDESLIIAEPEAKVMRSSHRRQRSRRRRNKGKVGT